VDELAVWCFRINNGLWLQRGELPARQAIHSDVVALSPMWFSVVRCYPLWSDVVQCGK